MTHALLARTDSRVRTTDWWAVLVEVAVVVLGIIIAFELNEWDQRRQARAEGAAVLRHLSDEMAADINAIRAIRDQHRESTANYALLVAAIGNRANADEYRRRGASGCNLLRMPAVRYHSPGGLEAGERAELIQDLQLRHLIRHADAERVFNDRQLDYFRASFHRYSEVIEPHMHWQLGPSGAATCTVDIPALGADRAAVALLPKAGRDQQRFAEYRHRELTTVQAVINRARCLQQGSCASP
jgi:hypothetical protein